MKDSLRFRFPNEAIQTYSGEVKPFDSEVQKEGFILTDFNLQETYYFAVSVDNDASEFHFLAEKPHVISKEAYLKEGSVFLKEIQDKKLSKAIYSRVKSVDFDEVKVIQLFEALCEKYPNALVYLLSSKVLGTWIGASPEVLLETDDLYMYTMALAGTKKSENIDWTEKEIIEQAFVTDYIVDTLKFIKVDDIHTVGPFDFHAGPVMHLRTDISAQLTETPIWEVAKALHPTPAVSGLPRAEAIDLIHRVEQHERSLYSGMIGFVSQSFTRMFVNLRCAQIQHQHIYLYLGGGYTANSVVENEWMETENKSRTLLDVVENLS